MSGLRNQKNKLRSFIYDMRDELISGIEDKSIDEKKVKLLYNKMLDAFQEFREICNDLHKRWEVYKEVDKQARLQGEFTQVSSLVQETTQLVIEYEEVLRNEQARQHARHHEDEPRILKERKPSRTGLDQQIEKLISQLENSIADIGQQLNRRMFTRSSQLLRVIPLKCQFS